MYSFVFSLTVLIVTFSVSRGTKFLNPCKAGGYQGDVALSDEDLQTLLPHRTRRAVSNEIDRLWPNGIIPYEISSDFNGNAKAVIRAAIRHWESETCITFVERQEEAEYVIFQNDGDCGCCSFVGRMGEGQAQGINLAPNCIRNGTIIHEIGHLIGFWHEHTRPDRDQHVEILKGNVLAGELKNFRKLTTSEVNSRGIRYDFGSIMHYAENTFSKNGFEITIRPRPGLYRGQIGQRVRLSPLDIKQAKLLYNCPSCGQTLTDSKKSFSFLTSQMKVTSPRTCTWRIMWTDGEKLTLKFSYTFFKFKCKRSYLEIREGKSMKSASKVTRYCKGRRKPPEKLVFSTPNVWITFHYGYRYYYGGDKPIGFKAEYEISCGGVIRANKGMIRSPNYPENYKADQNCEWELIVQQDAKAAVKFMMFELEESDDCEFDHVQLIDGETGKQLLKHCGSKIPKTHFVSKNNRMKIKFVTDGDVHLGGFSLQFLSEIDECQLGQHNCSKFCNNTVGGYECSCSGRDQLHSNGRDCETACGRTYSSTERSGEIMSPSYPDNYPINRRCTWEIYAERGYKISLTIKDFDLEDNKVCNPNYDYLQIDSGNTREKFCGAMKTPKHIESEANMMVIDFHSDNTVAGRGFKAQFVHFKDYCAIKNGGCSQICRNTAKSSKCSCRYGYTLKSDMKTCIAGDCNTNVNSTTGMGYITSPDYPSLYQSQKLCKWRVKTVKGQKFNITIKAMKCDRRKNSFLKISWIQFPKRESKQICDSKEDKGMHIPTSGNIFDVQFKLGNADKGSFKIIYTSSCGGTLVAKRRAQKFFSHLKYGAANYPPNQNCEWIIFARGGKGKVELRFKKFRLEDKPCNFDYIKVYDGKKADPQKLLSTECGHSMQEQTYSSTGNYLVVHFRSDKSINDAGFEAEFKKIRMRKKRHHIRLYDPVNDAAMNSRTRDLFF